MCEVMDGVSGIAVGVGGMTVFLFSHTPPLEVAKQLGVPSDIMDVKHYPQPQKATKAKAKELQQPPTHTRPPPQRTPRTSPARAPPAHSQRPGAGVPMAKSDTLPPVSM